MLDSGERELAAIDAFLRKIDPEKITWERAFPARVKPGPKHKPGMPPAGFKDTHASGVTGHDLIEIMKERLEKYYRGADCPFDAIVIIDDADCRFLDDGSLDRFRADIEQKVRSWTSRPDLQFVPMLASPEVESWLLADWEQGFGEEFKSIEIPFRRTLERDLLGRAPWTSIEHFGGPFDKDRGSCTRKLSDEVNSMLGRLAMEKGEAAEQRAYTYSKRENGPDMLRRVRPEKVVETCRTILRPAILALRALADRFLQN